MRLIDKTTDIDHDAACLLVFDAIKREYGGDATKVELESPAGGGFIDVLAWVKKEPARVHGCDSLVIIVEVKTGKDEQSPGGWLRQMKAYKAKTWIPSHVPAAEPEPVEMWLVHTHALTEAQKAYLDAAGVSHIPIDKFRQ